MKEIKSTSMTESSIYVSEDGKKFDNSYSCFAHEFYYEKEKLKTDIESAYHGPVIEAGGRWCDTLTWQGR